MPQPTRPACVMMTQYWPLRQRLLTPRATPFWNCMGREIERGSASAMERTRGMLETGRRTVARSPRRLASSRMKSYNLRKRARAQRYRRGRKPALLPGAIKGYNDGFLSAFTSYRWVDGR